MSWQSPDRIETARLAGTERELASRTVDRCAAELRRAREDARRAREALRRALRGVEEAADAFHQATHRLDRSAGLRAEAR